MSHEHTEPSNVQKVFKSMHRRMSSFGRSSKSAKSPYEAHEVTTPENDVSSAQLSVHSAVSNRFDKRDTRLFSLDKLLPGASITDRQRRWFEQVNVAVRNLMNGPIYDASHDYEHIQRVVMNARIIWLAEKHHDEFHNVDPLVVYVAAMCHDIGDDKYRNDECDDVYFDSTVQEPDETKRERVRDVIQEFLKKVAPECPPSVWGPVSHIVSLVSFTRETHNRELVANESKAYPSLKIVQDADRLDGLGAVGIARAVLYNGLHGPQGMGTVRKFAQVVDDRLSRYPNLMKTNTGKKEAEKKWVVMKRIRDEMVEETNCQDVLEAF